MKSYKSLTKIILVLTVLSSITGSSTVREFAGKLLSGAETARKVVQPSPVDVLPVLEQEVLPEAKKLLKKVKKEDLDSLKTGLHKLVEKGREALPE